MLKLSFLCETFYMKPAFIVLTVPGIQVLILKSTFTYLAGDLKSYWIRMKQQHFVYLHFKGGRRGSAAERDDAQAR